MVYLTFSDGRSDKFYEVTVDDVEVIIRYGRIGTQGQTSRSAYDSAAAAQSAADKKIAEKLKKGYVRSPNTMRDLPERFQPLRTVLESQLEPYIKIRATEADDDPPALWGSKIGGEPYLPKGDEYPRDRFTGDLMPLLIQINCADVPQLAGFDFPEQGILQVYLGYCAAQSELSQERCRVLYFPEFSENEDEVVTDFSFIDYTDTLQAYMDAAVYSLEFTVEHNFRTSELSEDVEIPEELIDLYEEFKDEYSSPEADRLGRLISASDLSDIDAAFAIEDFPGKVFLELAETMPNGEYLLFVIEDEDLKRRDFSKVQVGIVFY